MGSELKLSNVLPLPSDNLNNNKKNTKDLFVKDFSLEKYVKYRAVVTVADGSRPLKVTLAWYDDASVSGTSRSLLINNADLKVVYNTVVYLG